MSALPFVLPLVVGPAVGLLADWLRSKLSTTAVRKLLCVIGSALTGCFLIVEGYVGCNRALAVAIICMVTACATVTFSTAVVNQLDLAPLHAGKIMGLTMTVANLGSVAAPHAVSVLTYRRSTISEWRGVFYLIAAVYAVSAVVYVVFGSGDRQSWADDSDASRDELKHGDSLHRKT